MDPTRILSVSISALIFTLASSGVAHGETWAGTLNGTTESWIVGANWSPASVPNAVDASANLNVDFSANKIISLNQSITLGALTLGDSSGTSTLTLNSGTGTNTLTLDVSTGNAAITSAGGSNTISTLVALADHLNVTSNSAVTLSGVISETVAGLSITKLAAGTNSLTLSGNNTFTGGVVNQRGTINLGGASNGNLGSGVFSWANLVGGGNNTLSLNTNVSKTFANNFVNDNAATVTGTEYAQFSYSGGTTSYRVTTFNGTFSTGANYAATQSLFLQANGTATGLAEGAIVLNGSWAGYTAGANTQAIRINEGAVIINAATAIAATGGYTFTGNSSVVGAKLLLGAAYTMSNALNFASGANGMRATFGSRNAAATTATMDGAVTLSDADGANIVAQNAGATLTLGGQVSGANALRINEAYTLTTGDAANSLQTPAGTVRLGRAAGNTNSGTVTVMGGRLLAENISGSATGTGAVTVGNISGAISGQSGTTAATSRAITGFTTATAQGLQIGQSISGTNIPAGAIITGITIGSGAANSTVVIDKTTTTAGTSADLAFGAFTVNGVLGGTGRIAPTGANGVTVNSGSSLDLTDGVAADLDFDLLGTGSATFASGATFKLELGAPGTSDVVDFAGLADSSSVFFNSNVINFLDIGGLAEGTYTLFTFDTASDYSGTLAIGTGLEAFGNSSIVYNSSDVQLIVAVPEPGSGVALLGGLGVLAMIRRRRA